MILRKKVEQGTKLVTQAGATMKEIVNAIQRVTSIMSQIASASVEQSSGIGQVNQAISQMDDVTQQNAALVEQAAAAAESLEEQAQQLADTLSLFRLSSSFTRELKTYAPATTRAPTPVKNAVVPVKKIPVEHLESINQGLDVAIHKHSEWKVKFRSAIVHHEHLDVEKISKDNCCDFGKWLYSPIREQLGHLDTFQACVEKHAEFHTEAAKVAAAINEQNFDAANEMLHGDSSRFVSASSAVGAAIMRLKRDVALAASPAPSTPPVKKELVTSASDDDWVEF
ncbi:methyl-accepting chemotaxis protein [Methylocucumis oryzae]|uniref:methyl-accepting chemotaxis protein n=1 Tax=Methylocucumis oryzae TaxID=1632867 RepID=UPI000696BEAB